MVSPRLRRNSPRGHVTLTQKGVLAMTVLERSAAQETAQVARDRVNSQEIVSHACDRNDEEVPASEACDNINAECLGRL